MMKISLCKLNYSVELNGTVLDAHDGLRNHPLYGALLLLKRSVNCPVVVFSVGSGQEGNGQVLMVFLI